MLNYVEALVKARDIFISAPNNSVCTQIAITKAVGFGNRPLDYRIMEEVVIPANDIPDSGGSPAVSVWKWNDALTRDEVIAGFDKSIAFAKQLESKGE